METYETEEQQVEALKAWWQENGQSTIVGVVFGIAMILGWDYWQGYKKGISEQASAAYTELTKAVEAGKMDSVGKLAERTQTEFSGTQYAAYSGLVEAKVKADAGDYAAAKKILEKVALNPNKEISNLAKLRLVRVMLATKEYEQGLQLINQVDPANSTSFSGNYDELVGDLYVALNRLDQARTSYQKAWDGGYHSPLLQLKIDDLTAPEKVTSGK